MGRLASAAWAVLLGTAAASSAAQDAVRPGDPPGPRLSSRWVLGDTPRLPLSDPQRAALTDKKRDEVIRQLERIAQRTEAQSPQKGELLFQLSEFYWEKSRYLYQAEMERQEAAAQAGKPAETANHAESERYRALTVAIYERLLEEYPAFPRKDQVLFSLAYNLGETDREPASIARYKELIEKFPKSPFIGDAHIQLGNAFFDGNQLAPARHHYEQAMKAAVPKVYSYALYKLAWCDYNIGQFDQTLKKLKDVVAFAENRGREMVDLKNEALNDLVVVYVRLDRPQEAIDYFAHRAPRERQEVLLGRLADALAQTGQHTSAITIYRLLIERNPGSPKAPEHQQALVRSFEGLRQRDQVKNEVKRLAERYRPGGEWWTRNQKDAAALRNAFSVSEEALRTVVTEYHQEAQKTQQVETYRLARDIYRQYLEGFGSSQDAERVSDHAFNMRFYYAEIFWTLEDWEAAAAEYDRVVAMGIPERPGAKEISQERYRAVAAYNAILAYDKLVKRDRGELKETALRDGQKVDEKRSKGAVAESGSVERKSPTLPAQPLTKHEAKLVAACDTYVKKFPSARDEIDIRYRAAMALYGKNRFTEAAQRFGEIILRWPEERRSQEAADLTLYVLETQGKWSELYEIARRFAENPKLAKPGSEFAQRLAQVVEGSRYKWIAESIYTQEKNAPKAAVEFVKYVDDFPRSSHAPKALAYAMVIAREAGDLSQARAAGERLLREYSHSPLELKTRYELSHLYEQVGEFEKAAAMDEAFVSAFDRHHRGTPAGRAAGDDGQAEEHATLVKEAEAWVPDALLNAAVWWEGTGKIDKALGAYRAFLARYAQRKDAPEALASLASLLRRERRLPEAEKALEQLVTEHAGSLSPLRLYEIRGERLHVLAELRNAGAADRLRDEVVAGYGRLPTEAKKDVRALDVYAYARFLKLEPRWAEYRRAHLDRARSLKADLAAKQSKLKELERGYVEVLEVGSGEQGVAALTRIGLAYADLAESILESATPGGLDEEQRTLYRDELVKLSSPVEDKAVEVLERGVAKAYELAVYTPFVIEAQEQINKYRPGRYEGVRTVPMEGGVNLGSTPRPPATPQPTAQGVAGGEGKEERDG